MSVTVKFIGVKEIDNCLSQMPKDLTHKVLQAAHADAAKPLLERAKQLAPVGATHNLVDSLGIFKPSIKRASEVGLVEEGPRRTRRRKGYHAHLLEYGHKSRKKPGGKGQDFVKAYPFQRPAFAQTKDQVIGRIATSTGKVLIRTMKRTLK